MKNEKIFPEWEEPDDDDFEETEFIRCSRCDGHDACEDFGCAYEHGLGHMVEKSKRKSGMASNDDF